MTQNLQKIKFAGPLFFAVGLFLLLFLPLEFFNKQIQSLHQSEKEIARIDLKDRLLQEISDFQADLKPEIFVQKNLAHFEKKVTSGIVDVLKSNADSDETAGNLDCEAFNRELENYFLRKFKIRPLFIVSADRFLMKAFAAGADRIKKGKYSQKEVFAFLLDAGLQNYHEKVIIGKYKDLPASLYRMSEEIFSSYNNQLLKKGLIIKIFSDHYDFQNLYLYHQELEKDGQTLGRFTIGFREEDLPVSGLQKFALTQNSSEIERRFVKSHENRAARIGFFQKDNQVGYLDNVSSEFASVARMNRRTRQNEIVAPKILVRAKVPENLGFKRLLKLISALKKALLLLIFAIFIWSVLNGFHLSLQLRRKFLLIATAVLLPPALLLSLFLTLTSEKIQAEKSAQARNKLQKKLHTAELLLKEDTIRQSLSVLGFKDRIKKFTPDHFEKIESFLPELKNLAPVVRYGLLLNRFGKMLAVPFENQNLLKKNSALVLNDCVRYLHNLRSLDSSKAEVRSQLERMQYADAFIGDYFMMIDDLGSIMAEEILNVPNITQASPLARMNFILLPDFQTNPVKPWAFASLIALRSGYFQCLLENQKNFFTEFLHESDGEAEYFINFVTRDTQLISELCYKSDSNGWPEMQRIFNSAMETGSSGSRTLRQGNRTEIHMWLFNENFAYIIGGICYLSEKAQPSPVAGLIPVFVLLMVLVSLLILAEIMAQLFLRPIMVMQNCANEIASTADLNQKIQISGNDEFTFMGSAFNEMTNGLKEKQHLSRFVSGRLVKRISGNQENRSVAERVFVSLIFSDIRNFTAITEQNDPAEVVDMLNQYFTEMEKAIIDCGGIIDRFVGDAVIAVFYPDNCAKNTAVSACAAALKMKACLACFNQQRLEQGEFAVENGIGIASGEVISGSIGKAGRPLEYSVVGKTVSYANELEGRTKEFKNCRALVDQITANLAAKEFEFLAASENQFQLLDEKNV